VRFNADAVPAEVGRIAGALGGADDAARAIDGLRERIGLPSSLREVGVGEEDLEVVARLSQANHNVARNPRPVSESDALAILQAAW
jgi:alcohol dehydrogenase class IV